MKKFVLTYLILIITSVINFGQEETPFPILSEADIESGVITRTGYYDGEALWGLIDGGADLYLEYGFDKLLLQLIDWKGYNFRIEIYRMKSPEAAFGIYSVNHYKCVMNDTLTKFICITPYQVQSAIGNYYFSVANDKGNNDAQNLTVELFNKLSLQTNQILFEIPEYFNKKSFEPYIDKLKFITGKLGLQNGFPIWNDLLEDYSNYEAYILPIEKDEEYAYILKIKFHSDQDAEKFIKANLIHIEKLFPNEIIFIDSNFPEQELNKLLMN